MASSAPATATVCSHDPAERACGAPGCAKPPVSRCSRCRRVGYCGPACQRAHWPAHKAECARVAAELAAIGNAVVPVKRPGEAAREARAAAEWAEVDFLRASEAAYLASAAGTAPAAEQRRTLKFAAAGDAIAQRMVGSSLGSAGQHALAAAWMRRAAVAGDAIAQFILGTLYESGNGLKQDSTAAASWYAKAAAQGHAEAQFLLGLRLISGRGVVRDRAAAGAWLARAAEQGHREANRVLSGIAFTSFTLTAAEVAQLIAQAAQGVAQAQHDSGVVHEHGFGVTRDIAVAVEWYNKAAAQGFASSQCRLGQLHRTGVGVARDDAAAAAWLAKAAAQGDAEAQFELGRLYALGEGVARNAAAADMWLAKAAEQGQEKAIAELARLRSAVTE